MNPSSLAARNRIAAAPAAALLFLALSACASYTQETAEIRSLYRGEAYQQALDKLEKSSLKDSSKDRLLYHLEKGMIQERLGDGAKARATFIQADKVADQLYTTSISRTAASFVVNDATAEYAGEDYEKVAIHTMLALSYLHDKDQASARVEARKISSKLDEINGGYDDHKNRYSEDAFARYLSGMIYEARGELDEAIIDYSKAVAAYAGAFSGFVDGGVPDSLVAAYARLLVVKKRSDRLPKLEKDYPKAMAAATSASDSDGTGELIVIHEFGHIATKTAQDFFLPFGRQVVRFSFPVIRKSNSYSGQTGVTIVKGTDQSGKYTGADNVEDLAAIARDSLEDRRLRMVAKQTARLIAKGQLTEQAYKSFGPLGGLAANVFSAVTETADTRSWTLLPEGFYVTRVRLKAGSYTVKVQTGGRAGQISTVEIPKNKIVFLRDIG